MNSKSLFRIVAIGLVAGSLLIGQATRTLASTTGEISGTITDATTNTPIANARISAVSASAAYKTVANAKGYYAILNVFPDTYVVTASANGYEAATSLGNTVNQDQTTSVNLSLRRAVRSLGRVTVRSAVSIVQPNTAPDQYVLNASTVNATNGSGGSFSLYQTPGVIGTLPGVTTDPSGYSHIRGSRLEEIGYEYDGLTTVEPLSGLFSTNLVNDGLARVELSTGGYSAAGGNAISGVVNTVVGVGAYPGRGDATLLVQGPTFYHGINFNYGNGTPDNRFTYFLSGVWWNSDYDWRQAPGLNIAGAQSLETSFGNATINDVNPSRDQVVNLHYRFGAGLDNDLQFLTTNGIEHYDYNALLGRDPVWPSTNPAVAAAVGNPGLAIYFDPATGMCSSVPGGGGYEIALFVSQTSCAQKIGQFMTDHDDQGYFIDKVQLTHNFSSSSFAVVRYARVGSYVTFFFPFGGGCFGCDVWENRHSDQQELGLEFTSQINAQNLVKLGAESNYSNNYLAELLSSLEEGLVEPSDNHDTSFYLADTYRPFNRLTIDLSGRSDARKYLRLQSPAFTAQAMQGRFGFAYQATRTTVLRGSYGNFIELPYTSRVERIFTVPPNFMDIAPANQLAYRAAQPDVPQSHSYDFALEQELGHGLSLKVDPFWRNTTDLVLSLHLPGQAHALPQSVGPYYTQGVEAVLQFDHGGQGWSGFIDYTHTRALSAVTGDYNQTIPTAVYLAKALFPASFISPNVANLVATYRHEKWTINPNIEYVGGYPYGVGRLTYALNSNNQPIIVQNTFSNSGGVSNAFYPGTNVLLDPNESTFADGRVCCASVVANLNLYYDVTPKVQMGVQIQNLTRNYRATGLEQNPYFPGAFGFGGISGFNGFVNYGDSPYIPSAINGAQEYLFTVTTKI